MTKPPENYGSIDRNETDDWGAPTDGSKPIGMKEGKCTYVLLLNGDDRDAKTLETARKNAAKGASVLVGTVDIVRRFLFPGAMDEEE